MMPPSTYGRASDTVGDNAMAQRERETTCERVYDTTHTKTRLSVSDILTRTLQGTVMVMYGIRGLGSGVTVYVATLCPGCIGLTNRGVNRQTRIHLQGALVRCGAAAGARGAVPVANGAFTLYPTAGPGPAM